MSIKDLIKFSRDKENSKAKDTETPSQYPASELYEGAVQLAIKSSVDFEQLNQFKKYLGTIGKLRIVFNIWSEEEGTTIIVLLEKPMPLARILSQMPVVEQVYNERTKRCGGIKDLGNKLRRISIFLPCQTSLT